MTFLLKNWHIILAGIVGLYELAVRLIPSISVKFSLLGKIIEILKWISDHFTIGK